ncbi:MAG: hypothetical protein ACM32F_07590 [Betaproteobacteria bacterium]
MRDVSQYRDEPVSEREGPTGDAHSGHTSGAEPLAQRSVAASNRRKFERLDLEADRETRAQTRPWLSKDVVHRGGRQEQEIARVARSADRVALRELSDPRYVVTRLS